MAELELKPGAQVAKELGIYLGQLYGWVKKGSVKNYKEDGYPNGKGLIVNPAEAKLAWMSSKKRGSRGPKGTGPAHPRSKGGGAIGSEGGSRHTRKMAAGTIVSYAQGQSSTDLYAHRPKYNIGQVVGTTGRLTFIEDGDHRTHYNGVQIDSVVFPTDHLAHMLARGVAHIERPINVLGMVLLSFVAAGKEELAQSLEDWMIAEGLEVIVPELLEPDDEDLLEETAQPVSDEDED
jgi:hypothetical protein